MVQLCYELKKFLPKGYEEAIDSAYSFNIYNVQLLQTTDHFPARSCKLKTPDGTHELFITADVNSSVHNSVNKSIFLLWCERKALLCQESTIPHVIVQNFELHFPILGKYHNWNLNFRKCTTGSTFDHVVLVLVMAFDITRSVAISREIFQYFKEHR